MHIDWLACVWKERNDRRFWQKEETIAHLLDKVKLLSF